MPVSEKRLGTGTHPRAPAGPARLGKQRPVGWSVFIAAAISSPSVLATEANAGTADRPGPPRASGPEEWVEFEAGQVTLDSEHQRMQLEEDVVVTVDRYRLTSDKVALSLGPRGVEVQGAGRVAFCPCEHPPVAVGFRSATVAPPTDLLLEHPTLRVGSVPVFWLPYLWLRSPERPGLLPPRAAWRARDGLLLGSGVHLPLGPRRPGKVRPKLDLLGAGYVKGGAQVEGRLTSERTTTRVLWDYRRQGFLDLLALGAATRRDQRATLAWSADAIRGPRGRSGTLDLEAASRRYDRALVSLSHIRGPWEVGGGARLDVPRASSFTEVGSAGPNLFLGAGSGLGRAGTVSWAAGGQTSQAEGGPLTQLEEHGSMEIAARPGPFTATLAVHQAGSVTLTDRHQGASLGAEADLGFSLPVAREFGRGGDPVRHLIEPFAAARARKGRSSSRLLETWEPNGRELVAVVGGGRTSLGHRLRRGAAALEVAGGSIGPPEGLIPAAVARVLVDTRYLAIGSEGYVTASNPTGLYTLLRTRVGREDQVHGGFYAEGRELAQPALARWIRSEGERLSGGWLDLPGWTIGSRVTLPWTRWLASTAAADYDAAGGDLLGVRGSTAYRHPCGCLAILGWVGRRIGRPGTDAWVTVDLAP